MFSDYYGYFTPIREYMPQNCSADVEAVIAYLDDSYFSNDTAAVESIQAAFNLTSLTHIGDFASARMTLVLIPVVDAEFDLPR